MRQLVLDSRRLMGSKKILRWWNHGRRNADLTTDTFYGGKQWMIAADRKESGRRSTQERLLSASMLHGCNVLGSNFEAAKIVKLFLMVKEIK